jgi:long-subunit fatty acid transport protein
VRLTPTTLLLIVAIVIFLVAAIGVRVGDISLLAIGLAAFAAAFLFDRVPLR